MNLYKIVTPIIALSSLSNAQNLTDGQQQNAAIRNIDGQSAMTKAGIAGTIIAGVIAYML
ncbi:uncharacterized protein NDAI_0E00460 [Naumovozyma dairenensis CBS 421]|uniref:Uncharacterized protein n=1 Tax=Naumovozyma dairenensis (strain ATCC 10597 / BCRC 20456 / CBS 421 / NBRC 0211 / NRRL Y-12639) TaxID=1071378 RepID=G0WAU2_NAUDC|nr:hypothetical protein NDAI_0E00460 [Naumovozyma dairenensis CBS 421]CCD24862.1 hypothetical protein NDAI_0E00460 [Naumovozyma dairenensis CBS 421]